MGGHAGYWSPKGGGSVARVVLGLRVGAILLKRVSLTTLVCKKKLLIL